MSETRRVNIVDIVDHQPLGRFQVGIILLCGAVLFLEGFDSQTIAYAAPLMIQAWHVPVPVFGPVFSAGLLGILLGVLCMGTLSDYLGRRSIVIGSTLVFGALTLVTPAMHSVGSLSLLRLVTGFALGGTIPNAVALTSEYCPRRRRAFLLMLMICGISLGASAAGAVASQLLPRFGWPSVFYAGGILPLVLTPLLLWGLPESIQFLAAKGGRNEGIAGVLRRLYPRLVLPAGSTFGIPEETRGGFTVGELFRERRTTITLLVWVMFVGNMLTYYFLRSWLPTVIHESGLSLQRAVIATSLLDFGGVLGTLCFGWLFDSVNKCALLGILYLGGAVLTGFIGVSSHAPDWLLVVVGVAGIFLISAQNAVNVVVVDFYPTFMRSTALGWAIGIGRIGSTVAPLLGSVLLAAHWNLGPLFVVSAVPAGLAGVAALALVYLCRHSVGLTRMTLKPRPGAGAPT